ncbi:class D sortase [Cytobacillus oceanisediminis]|uniref:class D sortase n=1 Tax=Cytobacillus oceanisediminis TaxID=665099 RepID=UPI001C23A710|nr:class D sortase [Cytobacillus oceanisediminis]MBU8729990.1 class D sortase [Cytobacillus oceanisediminis]MBU8770751.1 class D sortase [Cytobacillus oceanisediminis]USK45398.1 class D sortase [Cytobacillus oceanisediminis]
MKVKSRLLLLAASFFILIGGGLVLFSLQEMYAQEKKTKDSLAQAQEGVQNEVNKESKSVLLTEQPIDISFEQGEAIGILKIPRLKAELPIIEGTDEDELEKGVGHYSTTVLPGQPDQILLSGHRDTVFRRLGELEIGDIFEVSMPYGKFTYEITDSKIVDADDTTVIRSTAPNEILTVSTCYPFSYVGNAPSRYILNAKRIQN